MKDLSSLAHEAAVMNGYDDPARYSLFEANVQNVAITARKLSMSLSTASLLDEHDLAMIGLQTLWKETEQYDPKINPSFWGYASTRVRGSMLDEVRKTDHLSRSIRDRIKTVKDKMESLRAESGEKATFDQACLVLGIAGKELAEVRECSTMSFVALDALSNGNDQGSNGLSVGDAIADPNAAEPFAHHDQESDLAAVQSFLDKLSPFNRSVIKLYFWSGISLNNIAISLDVTESRVCQCLSESIEHMRKLLKGKRNLFS